MASWVEAGQDPAQFWRLTPREIKIIFDGAARKIEREQLFFETSAWQSARLTTIGFHKPKAFPEFHKVSSAKPKRPPQSWQDQKAIVQILNSAFGGRVV